MFVVVVVVVGYVESCLPFRASSSPPSSLSIPCKGIVVFAAAAASSFRYVGIGIVEFAFMRVVVVATTTVAAASEMISSSFFLFSSCGFGCSASNADQASRHQTTGCQLTTAVYVFERWKFILGL